MAKVLGLNDDFVKKTKEQLARFDKVVPFRKKKKKL